MGVGGGGSGGAAKYDALLVEVKLLVAKYEEKEKEMKKLQMKLSKLDKDTDDHSHSSSVFAIISFVLWCLAIVYLVLMKVFLNEGSDVDVDMKKEQDFA